ncbi:MAG: hypothetical protein KJ875_15550 [Alphaproteobacteria bacterium]|nr:hypothetical protein [Alphaproteobacteria bacterium]MBU2162321.1 hypothetical protein [Alphaproteobacteria bacterium]MBU2243623.1 hypothetical protein [Alphaproteobacteria bacterium]
MTDLSKYNASAPMAGYIFQSRLALLRGLQLTRKSPQAIISIEKFDDVAFETEDHKNCLIQAKHHIVPKSLDDKSVDVWKTLKIWMEGAKSGVFEVSKTSYMLITTSEAPAGSAMGKLREGNSPDDVGEAYDLLLKAAEDSENKTTETARNLFRTLTEDEVCLLLSRILVIDNHPNLTNVFEELSAELNIVAPTSPNLAAEYLEGWWLNQVAQHLIEERCGGIPVQHIILKAFEIGKLLAEDALPIDDPADLSVKEYSFEDEGRLFVRQMRAVKLPDAMVQDATSDFYRAYAQRSRWSRESLILEDELSNYDDRLQDSWKRKFEADLLLADANDEPSKLKLGRSVFLWATQESTPLRNVVEKWITAGSYHGLADQNKVRWHPEFEQIALNDLEGEKNA